MICSGVISSERCWFTLQMFQEDMKIMQIKKTKLLREEAMVMAGVRGYCRHCSTAPSLQNCKLVRTRCRPQHRQYKSISIQRCKFYAENQNVIWGSDHQPLEWRRLHNWALLRIKFCSGAKFQFHCIRIAFQHNQVSRCNAPLDCNLPFTHYKWKRATRKSTINYLQNVSIYYYSFSVVLPSLHI